MKPTIFEIDWQQTYAVPVPDDSMSPRASHDETYYITRQMPLTPMLDLPAPVTAADLGLGAHCTVAVTRADGKIEFGFLSFIGNSQVAIRKLDSQIDWGIPADGVLSVEFVAGIMSRVDIPGMPVKPHAA